MIYGFAAIVVLMLIALEEILVAWRGDCKIDLDLKRVEDFEMHENEKELSLKFSIPFINTGKQQGLLIDCKSELQPEGDKYKIIDIHSKVISKSNPRYDDYWEANIIKPGGECWVLILIKVKATDLGLDKIKEYLERFVVDIFYKYYGRDLITYKKCSVKLKLSQFTPSTALSFKIMKTNAESSSSTRGSTYERVLPIRTHLLRPHEDIIGILEKYVSDKAETGDIIAIAESAVAILQGRVHYVEEIHPRFLARKISKLFAKDSSLSSPYSLEMAFREVGVFRILLATVVGVFGKIIGRSGDFYRVAGKRVATIDDCTGTIPPYDKCVVMGPINTDEVVRSIKEKTGLEAAIVDVNDLRKVDILAITNTAYIPLLQKSLEENPQGNANEQTPIVLIKAPERAKSTIGGHEPVD